MEKFRDRKFRILLYPDDPTHKAAFDSLSAAGYNFGACLHDKDIEDDGSLKKAHWHVVLRFKNPIYSTSLASQLGIAHNYILPCDNFDNALKYLIHDGWPEKYQYDIEAVSGPLRTRLASIVADVDESTRALNIFYIIHNSPGLVTYTEIFKKACDSGLFGDFRRMGSGVMALIKDHNEAVASAWRAEADAEHFEKVLDSMLFRSYCNGYDCAVDDKWKKINF